MVSTWVCRSQLTGGISLQLNENTAAGILVMNFQVTFSFLVRGTCPLKPHHQNLSDFLEIKVVLYLTSLPPPNTQKG